MTMLIITLCLSLLFIGSGIACFGLKLNNDNYIESERKSNPEFSNNKSIIFSTLGVILLVLGGLSAMSVGGLFFYRNNKTSLEFITPETFRPLMGYNSGSSTGTKDNTTPLGILTENTVRGRGVRLRDLNPFSSL